MNKKSLQSILFIVFMMTGVLGYCDCGSVPFYSPLLLPLYPVKMIGDMMDRTRISYDPLKVRVFEPAQRAIILWNGEEEILLLSTDQKSTEKSAILEVIPLPSEPKVRLGSLETFEAVHRLIVQKRMWACAHGGARAELIQAPQQAGRITFNERLGPHDISVAQVLSGDRFVEFVQSYLQEKYQTPEAPIRPEFVQIIQSYIDKGFRWFSFDVITLDESIKTREPIEYRFASDRVFYPLKISTLEQGSTRVDLVVFTPKQSASFQELESHRVSQEPQVDVAPEEVDLLDKSWKDFFNRSPQIVMNQWKIEGNSSDLTKDVVVK